MPLRAFQRGTTRVYCLTDFLIGLYEVSRSRSGNLNHSQRCFRLLTLRANWQMTVLDSPAGRGSCRERVCAQKRAFPNSKNLGAPRPEEGFAMTSILGRVRFSVKE